jgi:hypothetical protein
MVKLRKNSIDVKYLVVKKFIPLNPLYITITWYTKGKKAFSAIYQGVVKVI